MTTVQKSPDQESVISRFDWIIGAALYFVFAFVMIRSTSAGREIAAVWAANAVLIGVLTSQEKPKWVAVILSAFIANVFANLLTRDAFAASILYGVTNMIAVVVAAWLLRTKIGRTSVLSSLSIFFKFILIGLLAPMVGGLLGAIMSWWMFDGDFLTLWAAWSVSDALGILVFTPFFQAVFKGEYIKCIQEKSPLQRLETLALLILTLATACVIFFYYKAAPLFVLFVPTMLVTIRLGQLGTKLAVVLIAMVGLTSTTFEGDIFYSADEYGEQIFILQCFLFVLLFSSLPVAADLTERRSMNAALGKRERELTQIATTDSLTGLMNRSAFVERANQELCCRDNQQVCLVMIDVDHFKRINDAWGHQVGDEALRHLASVVGASLRSVDTLSRFGGDEFMLLLPRSNAADAERVCARLKENLQSSPLYLEDGTAVTVSVSCGIAFAERRGSFLELSKQADAALYEAKRAGRGTHRSATAPIDPLLRMASL
jgi:diguanylate cyclase (GGDEF)-like protein